MQSDHAGRPRHVVLAPGEYRRARQSRRTPLSKAILDEFRAFRDAVHGLGPSQATSRGWTTGGLFSRPVAEIVQGEIDRRVAADPHTFVHGPMPQADQLEAERLQLRRRRQQARKASPDPMLSRLCLHNWIGEHQMQAQIDSGRSDDVDLGPGSDVVVTAVIFHHHEMAAPVQELRLLGSNTLQDVADHLACFLEMNAPALASVLPSAYFLIEERFFDDHRHERLSQPVIHWLQSERRYAHHGLGPLQQGPCLRRTRLDECGLRPGSVYHYVHLGGCRHAILFTEVAILGEADVRKRSAYPLQTALIKEKRQQCGICDVNAAGFVTYGDRLAPANPFFYCDSCYYSMHYSEDGDLLYDGYKVYPYFCD